MVIFTGIHGNFYHDNSKNSQKIGYSLITVNFTVIFPEKFYPCNIETNNSLTVNISFSLCISYNI